MKKKLLFIIMLLSCIGITNAQVSKLDARRAKIKEASAKTKAVSKTATIDCNTAAFCPDAIEDLAVFCLFGNCNIPSCDLSNDNADGFITTTNSPLSITLTGGNNGLGSAGNTSYTITIPEDGTISFDWSYTTTDGAYYDYPQVIVNGVATTFTGYSTSGNNTQSGTMTVAVVAGDTFAFNMNTLDNVAGAASVTISNLIGPNSTTETYSYEWTATNGGVISGSTTNDSVTPTTAGTYTFTVTGNTIISTDYVDVTINSVDDASFSYDASVYCTANSDPTPTISGLSGGSFSSTSGLDIDSTTGTISILTSTAGTYTVTYTTAGSCPNSSTTTVQIGMTAPVVDAITVSYTGNCFDLGGIYNYKGLENGKNSYAYTKDDEFVIAYDGSQWVLYAGGDNTNTGFQNTTTSTALTPPLTGWTTTQCFNGEMEIQMGVNFCDGATVSDLFYSTTGTNLNYYDVASGGTALDTNSTDAIIAGDYYVTDTDNGCESERTMFSVAINPIPSAPTITASSTILCDGGTVTLTSSAATGNTWSTGETTQSIEVTSAGTYSVTTTTNTCPSDSSNEITISDAAIDDTVSELTTGILTANQTAASYQWYTCTDTAIDGETAQTYTPTVAGDYKVQITVGTCAVESECVTVATLGTKDFEINTKFLIYPNPSTGIINILSDSDGKFQIINQLGQTLKTFKVSANNVKSISVENLTEGIYIIKSSDKSKTYKFIKN